jgi:predicted  nucleic acid-binding Zn-ribbon protein
LEERKSQISKKIYSGEITNPRELSAFEDEIANLSDQIENSEDKLLLQMEESDKYDEGLQKASSKHEDAKNQHEILSHKLQAEREQLLALIERDTPVRDTARTLLSSETLRIYDSIRKSREGIAVSSVESNRCSTCRINVPLQIIQKLKSTSEFVYCNSCRRILLMST